MEKLNRRQFIAAAGVAAGVGCVPGASAANAACPIKPDPFKGTQGAPLVVGPPCLQAPGETTMGVSWAVNGLSKGVVELSEYPDLADSRIVKSGGYGLVPIDVSAINVRLENLRPGTKYYYRTITTPFIDYQNIYNAKLGESVISPVYSFTTMGAAAKGHFCVINDTHGQWKPFELAVKKVKELKPSVLVWNGDATNTTQDKRTAVEIFLDPPVKSKDFASEIPTAFVSGNHDFRGSWISKKEEVILPRHPAERRGDQWDLKWNFAHRLGDIAMIGMDTGEDKPDGHPKWFGLANFEAYRVQQVAWLKEALARPDIASARFKVLFGHIPLYAAPESADHAHDGVKIDPNDYAFWSRECYNLWAPIMAAGGVQVAICAHRHCFRVDRPDQGRKWIQIVGGGPECGVSRGKVDSSRFPTVIEGRQENDRLRIRVHDVYHNRLVFDEIVV